ncbi:MAG: hypothetical protein R2828_31375 [Saprospiraceae bacterium]
MDETTKKDKHLLVDADTHNKAKILAALKGKTVKDTIKELVDDGLKK